MFWEWIAALFLMALFLYVVWDGIQDEEYDDYLRIKDIVEEKCGKDNWTISCESGHCWYECKLMEAKNG